MAYVLSVSSDGSVNQLNGTGAPDRSRSSADLAARSTKRPRVTRGGAEQEVHRIWFERDPMPRFILDCGSRILEANAEARSLMASGVVGTSSLSSGLPHRDRARLDQAVKRVAQGWQTRSRVLVRDQDDAWCVIELVGVEELDGRVAAAIRRATELTAEHIEPLRPVFGLTPVETQVLTHVASGEAPKEIARILSMSIFTVRAHLRTIFMKLGVRGISGTLRLTLQLAL